MKNPRKFTGFALISTLAVLVAVAILITAFVSTMRTERIASHNYSEQRQAQALAQGMLNRILAEHAAPILSNEQPLKPYALKDDGSNLPDDETERNFIETDPPEPGIFRMEPQTGISTDNHLVRISKAAGGGGEAAYKPEDWAYLRLKDPIYGNTFVPKDSSGNAAPEWIDYTLPDGTVVGQVAFAIWEEGGKFDVNMVGEDTDPNGIAPHNLGIEQEFGLDDARAWLDADNVRERSNFSLRKISTNTGNDRRFFSVEELLRPPFNVDPTNAIGLTTFSRDFDVRPEWDGDRDPGKAKNFLRSYVNNPDLYKLMLGAGGAGPDLVQETMDERDLERALPSSSSEEEKESWMQIMRLLAALRLSLPPFHDNPGPGNPPPSPYPPASMNEWYNEDVWGIALNIVQASDTPSDENLVAKYPDNVIKTANQSNMRYGVRICPFITEVAFKIEYDSANKVKVTEYIEIWNPYPVDLTTEDYRYQAGETTGGSWPALGQALYSQGQGSLNRVQTSGPQAGGFEVVQLPTKTGMEFAKESGGQDRNYARVNGAWGLYMRMSTYLTDMKYYNSSDPWKYPCSRGPAYSGGGGSANLSYLPMVWIPPNAMPRTPSDAPVWYSFQIDDPRLGAFTRYSPNWKLNWSADWPSDTQGDQFHKGTNPDISDVDEKWNYSWKGYFNRHSLAKFPNDSAHYNGQSFKVAGVETPGFNHNFGDNWPWAGGKTQQNFDRAMATFALPGRPFRNVGELGTVFAFRPWRTLSFAKTIAPEDDNLKPDPNAEPRDYPTALLDYLTTVGTTSENQDLNYRMPGASAQGPTQFVEANVNERKQDKRWLFESVDSDGNPTGNVRPIRGRINLNTADVTTLRTLLKAPYRMVNSIGLKNWNWPGPSATEVPGSGPINDLEVTIAPNDAEAIAQAIVDPASGVRPLRGLFDLRKLEDAGVLQPLYAKYPESVVDAIMGRLAQFGTIRQQIYTVDILARTLNPKAKAKGQDVVTAEVRLLARVYFDTFSRKAFIESMEYR